MNHNARAGLRAYTRVRLDHFGRHLVAGVNRIFRAEWQFHAVMEM